MIVTESENNFINFIVDRLDSLRVEQCYSIFELAQRADISENTLKSIYKRKGIPSVLTIIRLCTALEITISDFFQTDKGKKALTKKELDILSIITRLSPKEQDAVLEILKLILM